MDNRMITITHTCCRYYGLLFSVTTTLAVWVLLLPYIRIVLICKFREMVNTKILITGLLLFLHGYESHCKLDTHFKLYRIVGAFIDKMIARCSAFLVPLATGTVS